MFNPRLDPSIDFNDPAKRQAFEDSYRATVGENTGSPLQQDSAGHWYFNSGIDASNRNTRDAQNDPEAPYKPLMKKAAIARAAYDVTTADIEEAAGVGYKNITDMYGKAMKDIRKIG
jgi:hypothetical protein